MIPILNVCTATFILPRWKFSWQDSWTETECIPYCFKPHPDSPSNASKAYSNGLATKNIVGQTVTYTCNTGYEYTDTTAENGKKKLVKQFSFTSTNLDLLPIA